jgi:multicomponent Na+:H+ antiporter subunit G
MITNILGITAVISGAFFLLVGGIGLIRLPDFYSRNHATGKSDTLGIMLVILGMIFIEGLTLNSAKLFFIFIFVFLTSPTGTHALANAAFQSGLRPWFKKRPKRGTNNVLGNRGDTVCFSPHLCRYLSRGERSSDRGGYSQRF